MSGEPGPGEATVVAALVRTLFARLAEVVAALPPDAVDARATPDGNSPAVIVAHVIGAARGSLLGIGCGLDVSRERDEEFRVRGGEPAALAESLRVFGDVAQAAILTAPRGLFEEVVVPPRALLGLMDPKPVPRRAALLSTLMHASEHLGELMLLRDVAQGSGSAGS